MPLDSRDIPQAPTLPRVRAVVDAVARGARTRGDVGQQTNMKMRDVGYYLNAATRVLGLLTEDPKGLGMTALGSALSRTPFGSDKERDVLARAVNTSEVLRAWVGGPLLSERPPSKSALIRRAIAAGLKDATATQRAATPFAWREHLLEPQSALPLESTPRASRVTDGGQGYERKATPPQPEVPQPRLTSLRVRDFKSFVDVTIPLAPLTVLVGANASGKSNALDAIRFLQGIAQELTVSDVLRGRHEGGRVVWKPIRGQIAEVCRNGTQSFAIDSVWTLEGRQLAHHIRCGITPVPLVHAESLRGVERGLGEYLFDTEAPALESSGGLVQGRALKVAVRGRGGGRNPTQTHSADCSLLGQLDLGPERRTHEVVSEWLPKVRKALASSMFLNITPSAMREYVPRQSLDLGADGANVSAMLAQADDGLRDQVVEYLSELCAPTVTKIEFIDTDLGDVMLALRESDGGRVSARSLSDGTLRFLGMVVALLTAASGDLLLIEEIENGLHPQRLHVLMQLLEVVTAEGVQVIVTTHSPQVLQALSERTRDDAVVFARRKTAPGTLVSRLGSLPSFADVVARRGVDHLFATGWLERALP